ncbi:pentapeptide repeat-containing protein [Nocardia takedensis]|uniref:pentapeptide repeat-containing protein n=1 Tax=Nocardia takedensis TaxID=259390 RepID=UPI000685C57F|nr:pentapeptide repeat-containing protein [Nocardia takedensis]
MAGRVSAVRAQARTKSATLRARLSADSRAAIGRRAGRIRLLPAVLLALTAGLGVAAAAYGFLRWITPVDASKGAAEIDITRVALTVVAGVGGVVALVIAYRRQRDLEQSRFVERFGAAAAQLGATDVAVRIAGVYAMAGVADESEGTRRQQCIDVLCGYLRLPYDAEHGASGRTKLVVKAPRVERGRVRGETEEHVEYRQNDREVRATIVRVIADHLRPKADYSWSASNFDFRTAHLEDVDLSNTTFAGDARFVGATFSGRTEFANTTFSGTAEFDEAIFSGDTRFVGASFAGTTQFDKVTFSGAIRFSGATFAGDAWFYKATFAGDTWFSETTFAGDNTWFSRATFSGATRFDRAAFAGTARFSGATFAGEAWFAKATFAGEAWFDKATFAGTARFSRATFADDTWFDEATFSGDTWFDRAAFAGDTRFDEATFFGSVRFVGVEFGAAAVSFVNPKQWGPPAPMFDWGHDVSQKPVNIEPQDWPPTVSTTS